jgi:hypothetical protein
MKGDKAGCVTEKIDVGAHDAVEVIIGIWAFRAGCDTSDIEVSRVGKTAAWFPLHRRRVQKDGLVFVTVCLPDPGDTPDQKDTVVQRDGVVECMMNFARHVGTLCPHIGLVAIGSYLVGLKGSHAPDFSLMDDANPLLHV